jgi:hypothetical protein
MHTENLPAFRLALGEKITQVQSRSTYHFDLAQILDEDIILVPGPIVFEYLHLRHGIVLPHAFFLSLATYAARVYAVRVMPHLECLKLDEALRLCAELAALFERSGWQQGNKKYPAIDKIKETVTHFASELHYTVLVQEWKAGYDKIRLLLRRQSKAGTASNRSGHDLFFVVVSLDNIIVRHQTHKQVLEQRYLDGVDSQTPRPIMLE